MTEIATSIVDTIREPVLVLERDLTVLHANRSFLAHFHVSQDETLGRRLHDLGNGQWDIPDLRRLLGKVLSENESVEDYRVEHEFETIGRRVMLLNARRLRRDPDMEHIFLAISDVTERERTESELLASKEFSEKLIDSIREALLVLEPDLRVESANQSFYDMFEVTPEETEGRPIYDIGDGQWDIPDLRMGLEDVLPKERQFNDFEVTHDFPTIGRRIMLLNGRALDHLPRILLAIRDETEKRRHEADQKVMVGELQHRVKNILANVQSIAMATLRRSSTLQEFEGTYLQRLNSLARAQDLLLREGSGYVNLHELVSSELAAHGWEEDGRLTIDGPNVTLSRRETQAFAMLVHELATNAVKYGAFAQPEGRLDVTWSIARKDGNVGLSFEWRESGVSFDEPPGRNGFGTGLIRQSVGHMLGGTSSLDFTPRGAVCKVEFALEA
ncbi:sensor histidine kinase [Chelativorans sp. M5D2P16]|uniref:sensor histidine kinase n=1 Tax=Chelativorans sp. M5D2P16 TaxID=3095678 RepID=UPI002ACADB67|nr:PAS domain-containing protein [Chelativorans sp. M5D2P16]MDZ5697808.1 PAS domain-containing protein [Chelativorans sp. M5D2P16]